jgi:hypothetical protein
MPAHRTKRAAAHKAAKKGHRPRTREKKEIRKGPDTEITSEVLDFIRALDDFKRSKNRPFPTWSEVLEVVKGLGYRR